MPVAQAGTGTPPTARTGSTVPASGYGSLFSDRSAAAPATPRFLSRIFARDRARHQPATTVEPTATAALTAGGALAAGLAPTGRKLALLPLLVAGGAPVLEGCETLEAVCFNPSTAESAAFAFATFAGFGVAIFLIAVGLGIGDRIRTGKWK